MDVLFTTIKLYKLYIDVVLLMVLVYCSVFLYRIFESRSSGFYNPNHSRLYVSRDVGHNQWRI